MGDIQKLVEEFFADYPIKRLDKGEALLRPGDEVKHISYLKTGSVIQYDISSAGNTVIVNAFKPGSFFPMSNILNKVPSAYFLEAAASSTIHAAPADQVIDFIKTNPAVTYDLLCRVYKGTDGLLGRMAQLMGGSATDRVVFELLNASQRFGQAKPNGSVLIKLSESDIAKRSGLSRETVNRMTKQLKTDGIIRITGHSIEISNIDRLQELADSANSS